MEVIVAEVPAAPEQSAAAQRTAPLRGAGNDCRRAILLGTTRLARDGGRLAAHYLLPWPEDAPGTPALCAVSDDACGFDADPCAVTDFAVAGPRAAPLAFADLAAAISVACAGAEAVVWSARVAVEAAAVLRVVDDPAGGVATLALVNVTAAAGCWCAAVAVVAEDDALTVALSDVVVGVAVVDAVGVAAAAVCFAAVVVDVAEAVAVGVAAVGWKAAAAVSCCTAAATVSSVLCAAVPTASMVCCTPELMAAPAFTTA